MWLIKFELLLTNWLPAQIQIDILKTRKLSLWKMAARHVTGAPFACEIGHEIPVSRKPDFPDYFLPPQSLQTHLPFLKSNGNSSTLKAQFSGMASSHDWLHLDLGRRCRLSHLVVSTIPKENTQGRWQSK
jgi:hypothetical protein